MSVFPPEYAHPFPLLAVPAIAAHAAPYFSSTYGIVGDLARRVEWDVEVDSAVKHIVECTFRLQFFKPAAHLIRTRLPLRSTSLMESLFERDCRNM